MEDWLIILNQTKTNSMTFTRKRETHWGDAKFNNVVIKDHHWFKKGTSHVILYKDLGFCPLPKRQKKKKKKNTKLIQFFKLLNNEAPPYNNDILTIFNTHETG